MATVPSANPDNRELVEVFESQQESEALVVQGLLESNGIESLMTGFDNPQDILPVGGVAVRVAADRADEARALIAAYHNENSEGEGDGDSAENSNV
jgi:putative signal transducing protein